jgi:hypothetical protein
MNKAKTAKVLSAAAAANMAAAGFATAPADGSVHPPAGTIQAGTTATAMPSTALQAAARAASSAAKRRGFIPRTTPGARINTETGCNGHLCWGLHGGGNHVSYVDEHFFNWPGCHIAHFFVSSPGGFKAPYTPTSAGGNLLYFCAQQDAVWPRSMVSRNWPTGTAFCGAFNTPGGDGRIPGGNTGLSGVWCETVR